MKKLSSYYKQGLWVLIPSFVIYFFGKTIWMSMIELASGVKSIFNLSFFANNNINAFIYLLIFLTLPFFIGGLFQIKIIRSFVDKIKQKLVKAIKEISGKEVRFNATKAKSRGVVTATWVDKNGEVWVGIYKAHVPAGVTGELFEEKKSEVEFTDNTAQEYFANVMSFGVRSDKNKDLPT